METEINVSQMGAAVGPKPEAILRVLFRYILRVELK